MAGRHASPVRRVAMAGPAGPGLSVPESLVEEYRRRGFRILEKPAAPEPAKKAAPRKRAAKKPTTE